MSEMATANRIKRLMEAKSLTYAELEKLTGIPKSALQRYVSGKTVNIPSERLSKIARALNSTPLFLLGWGKEDKITDFSHRINSYMIENHINSEELYELIKPYIKLNSEDLNVSYMDYEESKITQEKFNKLINGQEDATEYDTALFAKALGVSETWLSGLDVPNMAFTSKEKTDYNKNTTKDISGGTLPFVSYPLSESTVAMIPIVSTVRAGWNGVPEPVYDGTMAIYDQKNPQEYVWMKVEGDSMEPYIMEGDYVLVHLQPTAENGELVIAMLDGEEGTVKKYQRNASGVMLVPYNSKCPTVFVPNDRLDTFLIYGVVKKSMRNYI